MPRALRGLLLGSVLIGCASAPVVTKPTRDPKTAQQLREVVTEYQRLQKQLAELAPEDRLRCEFQAGDCSVLVSEARDKLIDHNSLSMCRGLEDANAKTACVTKELKKRAKEAELTSFYAYENMCFQRVLGCTSDLSDQALAAENRQRFEQRRRELETSPKGLSAWSDAELSQEKLKYLRSTLPPQASNVCEAMPEVTSCRKEVATNLKKFEATLLKDAYEPKAALAQYDAMKRKEASCSAPELSCVYQALQRYGALPESRKWTQRNMDLLERRQSLTIRAGSESVTLCLTELAEQHQERIVSAYKIYAREPVLYFRTQLEKAFMSMHQAQVYCLLGKSKSKRATQASAKK